MAVRTAMKEQFLQFVGGQRCTGTPNAALAAESTPLEPHFTMGTTIEEAKMQSLGPHIVRHIFADGHVEETPVRFHFLGPRETTISEGVTITEETGEVIVEFEDGEHRTFIAAENTFALVGWAIRLTEALFNGMSLDDSGEVYRLLPGDVKVPGDMFL
jgi:hypothetical protein